MNDPDRRGDSRPGRPNRESRGSRDGRPLPYFATCARGLEGLLETELRGFGATAVAPRALGVGFDGPPNILARACLWSRVANHVLHWLATYPAYDAHTLYEGARDYVDWARRLTPDKTIAVDVTHRGDLPQDEHGQGLTHTRFAALRLKDAIVDALRDAYGSRPDVDAQDPDVRVRLHLEDETAQLYLDASGHSLHRRGYRPGDAPAPLKETLAAGLLGLCGYTGVKPLVDPMCGSGTFLAEAALMATDRAPGMGRTFGLERWPHADPAVLAALREEARARVRPLTVHLAGYDVRQKSIALAARSLGALGLRPHAFAALQLGDAAEVLPTPDGPGLIIANPPYGERLEDDVSSEAAHATLGTLFKRHFAGWSAAVMTGNPEGARAIGLSPKRRHVVFNGPIECRLLTFELYAGSRREPPAGDAPP